MPDRTIHIPCSDYRLRTKTSTDLGIKPSLLSQAGAKYEYAIMMPGGGLQFSKIGDPAMRDGMIAGIDFFLGHVPELYKLKILGHTDCGFAKKYGKWDKSDDESKMAEYMAQAVEFLRRQFRTKEVNGEKIPIEVSAALIRLGESDIIDLKL